MSEYRSSGNNNRRPFHSSPFRRSSEGNGQRSQNHSFSGGFRGNGNRNNNRRFNNRPRPTGSMNESLYIKKAQVIAEAPAYTPSFSFDDLAISNTIKLNITEKGYTTPTPIQDQTIKHILAGEDVLGIADTGTGKSAAFLIPLINSIVQHPQSKVLIITPTRELAQQINDELITFARNLRLFSVLCIGGTNLDYQINALRRGCHFVIGTPGRLKDLIERKALHFEQFSAIVLDEVDRMLDMGFIDDIKFIVARLPEHRQSLFFSATVNQKTEEIIKLFLKPGYTRVSVKTGTTAQFVEQDVIRVADRSEKMLKLEELLKSTDIEKALVFSNTKFGAERIGTQLQKAGFKVGVIHGNKRQNVRKRTIDGFKRKAFNILVATDVAARGLDISGITHVINYDVPITYDDYVHRIGRTGRANKPGTAWTFIEKKGPVQSAETHSFPPRL